MDFRRSPRHLASPSPSCSQQVDENTPVEDTSLEYRFVEIKNKIKPLFGILGKSPTTNLEKAIMGTENVRMNQKFLDQAEDLLRQLMLLVEKRHLETRDLWNEISQFWHELEERHEPQLGFTNAHSGIYEALKTVKVEYLKRKEEKSRQIIQFINLLRSELTNIWNQCLISDEEKLVFTPFYDNNFNEELLQIHKEELQKWKVYQEKNQEVLHKAKKRAEMWAQLREIDAKAEDPSRFVNRGGALLKDQTLHASIMKNLPKLEAELKKLATRFEREHGRKVTIHGKDIHTLIDQEWDAYSNEKSLKKQATRSKIRQSVVPTHAQMGPPASVNKKAEKRVPPTPTQLAAKRKCFTPIANGTAADFS